jgi:hypothetical protein
MTSPSLQRKHHDCKIFGFNSTALGIVTDIIVLAERAKKVTGPEKDSAGTGISHKRCLFTKVGMQACNFGLFPCPTKAKFPG